MKEALVAMNFFFFRFSCQDTQNDVKRPEKLFKTKVRMDVCVCIYVEISEDSSFCISVINRPIELKFGVHLK